MYLSNWFTKLEGRSPIMEPVAKARTASDFANQRLAESFNPGWELFCAGSLVMAFGIFAALSWRTWPDILVDFGQELYVPWRLSAGDVLYRDVAWITGPLPQYANALLFQLFGVSLTTLIVSNLTLLAGIVAMLYYIFRQCGSRWSATCSGLFFLAVFAFAQQSLIGNFNYICPYRHDMTHGLILGLINLLCVAQFGRSRQIGWLLASGFVLGLLCLTKIEMTLAAGCTTAVALPLFAFQQKNLARTAVTTPLTSGGSHGMTRVRDVAYWSCIVIAAAVIPIAVAIIASARSLGWTDACRKIFAQYWIALSPELSTSTGYYRSISGADHPTENLIEMVFMAVVVFATAVAGCVAEKTLGRIRREDIWAPVLGIVITLGALTFVSANDWRAIAVALPLLLIPIIVMTLYRALRDSDASTTMLLLVAIYGIGLLPKIWLRVGWHHYGFVLAVPGTLVLIHVALHTIPAWLARQGWTGRWFQAIATGLLTACALSLVWGWMRIDNQKRAPVGKGGDLFYADPRFDIRTIPTLNTLAYLQEHMQADESLIVFPNGVMLNYLLRKRNPTPYIMFNPWESDVHGGEDLIADRVIAAAPDYAVIVTMNMTIHGRGNFGSPGFGGRIRQFLTDHYDVVFQDIAEGGFEGRFASVVFKRRSTPK